MRLWNPLRRARPAPPPAPAPTPAAVLCGMLAERVAALPALPQSPHSSGDYWRHTFARADGGSVEVSAYMWAVPLTIPALQAVQHMGSIKIWLRGPQRQLEEDVIVVPADSIALRLAVVQHRQRSVAEQLRLQQQAQASAALRAAEGLL